MHCPLPVVFHHSATSVRPADDIGSTRDRPAVLQMVLSVLAGWLEPGSGRRSPCRPQELRPCQNPGRSGV